MTIGTDVSSQSFLKDILYGNLDGETCVASTQSPCVVSFRFNATLRSGTSDRFIGPTATPGCSYVIECSYFRRLCPCRLSRFVGSSEPASSETDPLQILKGVKLSPPRQNHDPIASTCRPHAPSMNNVSRDLWSGETTCGVEQM